MSIFDEIRTDVSVFLGSVSGVLLYGAFDAPTVRAGVFLTAFAIGSFAVAHLAIRPLEKLWRREALSLVEGEKK